MTASACTGDSHYKSTCHHKLMLTMNIQFSLHSMLIFIRALKLAKKGSVQLKLDLIQAEEKQTI